MQFWSCESLHGEKEPRVRDNGQASFDGKAEEREGGEYWVRVGEFSRVMKMEDHEQARQDQHTRESSGDGAVQLELKGWISLGEGVARERRKDWRGAEPQRWSTY